jgi:anti-sigma B factor antagonist
LRFACGGRRLGLSSPRLFAAVLSGASARRHVTPMAKTINYQFLELTDVGEVLVVSFKQTSILDQPTIDQIGREFEQAQLEASGNRKLLLNFHAVEYMSSAMLGKLIQLQKRCKVDKIKLKLCTISKNPLDVFKITKLDKLFEIHPDIHAALATY